MAIESFHKLKCDANCGVEVEVEAEKSFFGGIKKGAYPSNWMQFRNYNFCDRCASSFEENFSSWLRSRKDANTPKHKK